MAEKPFRSFLYLFVVIILVVFVVFLVRPSILGYTIYQRVSASNYSIDDYAGSINDLKSSLAVATVNNSLCATQLAHVDSLHTEVSGLYQHCVEDRARLEVQLNASVEACTAQKLRFEDALNVSHLKLVEVEQAKKNEIMDLKAQKDDVVRQMSAERDAVALQLKEVCDLKMGNTERDLESLQSDYDALVRTTARSVCCKERIDDSSIDSYDVLNHRVVCISGGENKLEC